MISYYCITVQDLVKTCSKIDQNSGQNDGQNFILNSVNGHIYSTTFSYIRDNGSNNSTTL